MVANTCVTQTVCFSSAELIRSLEAAEQCVKMKVTSSLPVTLVTLKQIASLLCCLVRDFSRHHDRDAIRQPEPQLQPRILSSIMFSFHASEGQSVTRVEEIKEWRKSRRQLFLIVFLFFFYFFTFRLLLFVSFPWFHPRTLLTHGMNFRSLARYPHLCMWWRRKGQVLSSLSEPVRILSNWSPEKWR